jgi:DNA polymerase III delta subunit
VVEKALSQARNFGMAELLLLHDGVVQTDLAVKTGEIEPWLALDLLVVSVAESTPARI